MSSRVKLMMKLVTKEINKENFNSDEFPKVAKSDILKAKFDDTEHQCNDKNELGKWEPNKINENLLFDPDDNDDEYKDPDFDPDLSDNTESEGEMNIYKGNRHIKIKDVNEKQEKGEKHNRKSYPQDNIESEEDTVIGKSKKGMKRKAPYDINNEAEHKDVEIQNENTHPERSSSANCKDLTNNIINNSIQIPKRARTLSQQKFRNKLKHPILPEKIPCICRKRQCTTLFSMEERSSLHTQFWELNRYAQKLWLLNAIQEVPSSRKIEGSRRSFSRIYTFPRNEAQNITKKIRVCQKYFLCTLGYKSTSVIDHLLKNSKNEHGIPTMFPKEDGRGKHSPKNKKNRELIKIHIKSYHPRPSHYRREHAPKRLYLPPDLTIKAMHEDYNCNSLNEKVSYELYRKVVDEMNVAFYQADTDKCSTCIELDLNATEENLERKRLHIEEVKLRRYLYTQDSEKEDPNTNVYSADLQKVFLLPRMPKVKDSFFTSRLIAFNETFAAMGKSKQTPHYCILWHEAIAGRRAEDVACAFIKFVQLQRDTEKLIIWLDNCTGQNKNWVLYSALIIYINSEYCTTNNIILKYLLTGHTYMAADGLHGKIEQYVKKTGNVEDFNDFAECCDKSVSRSKVICLEISDFMKFENICKSVTTGSAQKKRSTAGDEVPFLNPLVEVQFTKGSQEFSYKTNFRDMEYKTTKNLLRRKIELKIPRPLTILRGVSPRKKDAIIKSLVPAMRASRKLFWENLLVTENAPDLLEEGF